MLRRRKDGEGGKFWQEGCVPFKEAETKRKEGGSPEEAAATSGVLRCCAAGGSRSYRWEEVSLDGVEYGRIHGPRLVHCSKSGPAGQGSPLQCAV